MNEISVRDLRNRGAEVLERVTGGETLTVTRAGVPVAELRPLGRQPRKAAILVERRTRLARVDPNGLRGDLDKAIDPTT